MIFVMFYVIALNSHLCSIGSIREIILVSKHAYRYIVETKQSMVKWWIHLSTLVNWSTTRHDTTRHDTTRHDTMRYDTTIRYDPIRYDTISFDTIRYDTIRYDTIRYDTIRYDTIRYDTIRSDVVLCSCTHANSLHT